MSDLPNTDLEYDPTSGTYAAFHDPDGTESVTVSIVSGVAALSGKSPLEMEPLYEVIDPESIDTLLRSTVTAPEASEVTVSFRFEGCDVTVDATGNIAITPSLE